MESGLDKILRMVSSLTGDQARKQIPKEIELLVNRAGRIKFSDLEKLAEVMRRDDFVHFVRRPALIGASLFQGKLKRLDGTLKTMQFTHAMEDDSETGVPSKDIQGGIYPLVKMHRKHQGHKRPNIFTIGRTDENDMVMPDYTISKLHAEIQIEDGYVLLDHRSTNRSYINSRPIEPNKPRPITYGDRLKFGRYEFHFLTPLELYERLK